MKTLQNRCLVLIWIIAAFVLVFQQVGCAVDDGGAANVSGNVGPLDKDKISIDCSGGKAFNRNILGQVYTYHCSGGKEGKHLFKGTSVRHVRTGSLSRTFNWKNLMGVNACDDERMETLPRLVDASKYNSESVFEVSIWGLGDGCTGEDFRYTDTSVSAIVDLAVDWVRYCNFIAPKYRQGDKLSPVDAALLSEIKWVKSPTLLAKNDRNTARKVKYWEIGNEDDHKVNGTKGLPPFNTITYRDRYKAITSAMLALDPTIKVGPSLSRIPNVGYDLELITDLLKDKTAQIDFVAHHPYDQLGQYLDSDLDKLSARLGRIYSIQKRIYQDCRDTLAKHGRDPDKIEVMYTEWSPMSDGGNDENQSMAMALGTAESLFTFADIGVDHAHYWVKTKDKGVEWPVQKVFEAMLDHMGDTVTDRYIGTAKNKNLRIYTTRDTKNRRKIVIWALNFDNEKISTVNISLENLSFRPGKMTMMTLGEADEAKTSLRSRNRRSVNVDWRIKSVGLDSPRKGPAVFQLKVPQASIKVLIIRP